MWIKWIGFGKDIFKLSKYDIYRYMAWSLFFNKPKQLEIDDDIICGSRGESYWEIVILIPMYVLVLSPDSSGDSEDAQS